MEIPDRALQSALEFAVGVAAAGAKLRPPLEHPSGLKPYLRFHTLPAGALAPVRAVVEGDDRFRRRLGKVATPELLDEVGMLWLARPEGWEATVAELLAAAAPAAPDAAGELRRERRRREAAETAAARARLELVAAQEDLAREQAVATDAAAAAERLEAELAAARRQVRELETAVRRRSSSAATEATRADSERAGVAAEVAALRAEAAALRGELAAAVAARDEALADRARGGPAVDVDRLRTLLHEALAVAGEATPGARRVRRVPVAIPGGLYGDSEAAAEHLFRVEGVLVLVDGYNVGKLGWPGASLESQREATVRAAEDVARRWGTMIHVVFDGSDVVGAHARRRRLVRVSFSAAGVSADDVLRAEVAAQDPERTVVVVTNDQAVIADVRAAGANTVPSAAFVAVAHG